MEYESDMDAGKEEATESEKEYQEATEELEETEKNTWMEEI